MARSNASAQLTLEWRKSKRLPALVSEYELDARSAQPARAVIQEERLTA